MYYDARSTHKALRDAVQAEATLLEDFAKQSTVDNRAYWLRWHGVALLVASQRAAWAACLLADAPAGVEDRPWGESDSEEAFTWYAGVVYEAQSKVHGHASNGPASRSTSPASNLAEDALTTMAADVVRDSSPEVQLHIAQARIDRQREAAAEAQAKREAAERERLEAEAAREEAKRAARRERRLARRLAGIYPEGTR